MLEVQKFIVTHEQGIEAALEELTKAPYFLKVSTFEDRIHLVYTGRTEGDGDRFHPIVRECRGIILNRDGTKVMSRPFDRFYNATFNYPNSDHWYFEDSSAIFYNTPDHDTACIITEKSDGTFIQIYHDYHKWCIGTKGNAFAYNAPVLKRGGTFQDLVYTALDITSDEEFQRLLGRMDTKQTILLELTCPDNRIVKKYEEYSLRFLACRNRENGRYIHNPIPATALQYVPLFARIKQSKYHICKNMTEAAAYIHNYTEDAAKVLDEGFILIQQDSWCKIKYDHYLDMHQYCKNLSLEKIIELVYQNRHHVYLELHPESLKEIIEIRNGIEFLLIKLIQHFQIMCYDPYDPHLLHNEDLEKQIRIKIAREAENNTMKYLLFERIKRPELTVTQLLDSLREEKRVELIKDTMEKIKNG